MFSQNDASIVDVLTHHQILGIKYYDDLLNRIPYDEITKIDEYLTKLVENVNIKHFKSAQFKHQMVVPGRQSPTSGDIDVLFYNTLTNVMKMIKSSFPQKLCENSFQKSFKRSSY